MLAGDLLFQAVEQTPGVLTKTVDSIASRLDGLRRCQLLAQILRGNRKMSFEGIGRVIGAAHFGTFRCGGPLYGITRVAGIRAQNGFLGGRMRYRSVRTTRTPAASFSA
jgi:hypothetical protein